MAEDTESKLAVSSSEASPSGEELKQTLGKLKDRPRIGNRSADFLTVYSNSMSIEATFNDFKLIFGQVAEASTERLITDEKVAIIMGPEEVKSVAKLLTRQVVQYEKLFGPIRELPE